MGHDPDSIASYYEPYPEDPDPEVREAREQARVHDRERDLGYVALFDQGEVWFNVRHEKVRVADIDARYAGNLVRFLERQSPLYKFYYDLGHIHIVSGSFGPQGDMANELLDAELEREWGRDPVEWVRTTTLYRAIAQRAAA